MKKSIKLTLISLMLISINLTADVIKFETNTWRNQRPIVWSGTLIEIDKTTNLVYFEFKNNDKIDSFKVHVTRIYSLTIDEQDSVNRDLPKTRHDITTSLTTNPKKRRFLELTNQNSIVNDIPDNIHVTLNKENKIISLKGNIVFTREDIIMLSATTTDRNESSFKINRSDLLKWIR